MRAGIFNIGKIVEGAWYPPVYPAVAKVRLLYSLLAHAGAREVCLVPVEPVRVGSGAFRVQLYPE